MAKAGISNNALGMVAARSAGGVMRWHDDAPIGNRGSYHPNRERTKVWTFRRGLVVAIVAVVLGQFVAWLVWAL